MSVTYVEILQDSRSISVDRTSMNQTFSIQFQLEKQAADPLLLKAPVFAQATFLGETDDVLALETAYGIIPNSRWLPAKNGDALFLVLDSLNVKQVNNTDWWSAEFTYRFNERNGTGGQQAAVDDLTLPFIRIGFSAGGSSKRITQSYSCTGSSRTDLGPARPTPPNAQNTIGQTKDGIDGTEIPSGGLTLNITAYYFPSSLSRTFLRTLRDLMTECSTNNALFLTFEIGEVLLLSITGEVTVVDVIPITFTVSIKKNQVDTPDSPFGNLTATGHQVIDYRYVREFEPDSNVLLMKPEFRYIHTVFPTFNFALLGFPVA